MRTRQAGGEWRLGEGLSGSLADVRVWDRARSMEEVRTGRFQGDGTVDRAALVSASLAQDTDRLASPPDATVVTDDLPGDPATSGAVSAIRRAIIADHQVALREAETAAAESLVAAQNIALAQVTAARRRARRHTHLSSMTAGYLLRSSQAVLLRWGDSGDGQLVGSTSVVSEVLRGITRADQAGGGYFHVARSWPQGGISMLRASRNPFDIVAGTVNTGPVVALACGIVATATDVHGDAPDSSGPFEMYWIEEDGTLCRSGLTPTGYSGEREVLTPSPLPVGRSHVWDLAVAHGRLYWTNGWDVFESRIDGGMLGTTLAKVPHSASPHPIAIAAATDGTLVWLDAEDEVLRRLGPDDTAVVDLYPAARPAAGVELAEIDDGDGNEAVVYWTAATRRVLDVPLLHLPGQYLELSTRPSEGPTGQQISAVRTTHQAGDLWPTEPPPGLDSDDPHLFGPFPAGIVVKVKGRAYPAPGQFEVGLLAVLNSDGTKPLDEPAYLVNGGPVASNRADVGTVRYTPGQPYQLEVVVNPASDYQRLMASISTGDGASTAWGSSAYTDSGATGDQVWIQIPAAGQGVAGGELRSLTLTDFSSPPTLLAEFPEQPPSYDIPAGTIDAEPVAIDLSAGWTAVAHRIHWAGAGEVTAVYELATEDREDRLVCAIESDGLPTLRLRWAGRELPVQAPLSDITARVVVGKATDVAWVLSPTGVVTTYVDGVAVAEGSIGTSMHPRVFEAHRLGGPCPGPETAEVPGARLADVDPQVTYLPYRGWLGRFRAWTQPLPVIPGGPAPDTPAAPNPDWRREEVTVESRSRYLHAGTLDGTEPPLVLFAADLDAGLAVETTLSAASARFAMAHATKAAADHHAIALGRSAQAAGDAAVENARDRLTEAHATAEADVASARADADTACASAEAAKQAAVVDAADAKSAALAAAAQTRADGDARAAAIRNQAASVKNERVGGVAAQRDEVRTERDRQQQEYDSRR